MNFDIKIPEKLTQLWKDARYKVCYGGRSSGKSIAIAYFLLTKAIQKKCKILCTREYQSSIKDSTYAQLKQLIEIHDLHQYFTIKHDGIIGNNGSEFIFKGLARDIYSIKSIADIDYCFIEEAETIDHNTWNTLIPTIRKAGSEILIAFNPKDKQSATYERFVTNTPQSPTIKIKINYNDIASFLSKEMLQEIEDLRVNNYALYEHIYLGEPIDITEDVIFKGKFEIKEVNIEIYPTHFWYQGRKIEPLYGIDFGFSVDPFAMCEVFILDEHTIYISREIYEYKLLPSNYKKKIREVIPEAMTRKIMCDSARPDTIAELVQDGLRCEGAKKNKGSVEAGVEWLLGKKILIHPKCHNTIYEFQNYKYKLDKYSGRITTDIIDANNHIIDGIRYACCHLIEGGGKSILSLFANTKINITGVTSHF